MVNTYFADILGLGTPELIIILVILLVLFGAARLPKLAKSLGESVKELKKGAQDDSKDTAAPANRANDKAE
ncbi:MAG TPA: twin-arginine translocase TatA/TatE family subunit [Candidatus Saccharimonadales bacterium]|nr:twin-arginine translocase TatA/TatE family subunit [Candidatus Saccharimonadales bacterium]